MHLPNDLQASLRHAGCVACVVSMLVAACVYAQPDEDGSAHEGQRNQSAEKEESPGLAVGKQAPAFKLRSFDGTQHSLDSLLEGDQALALVFHRSADW